MTDRTLREKIDRLQSLQQEIDMLSAQAEALKDSIKSEMEARSVEELKTSSAIIRWKEVTSARFNASLFKQTYGSLYEQYTQPNTTRRFTLIPA